MQIFKDALEDSHIHIRHIMECSQEYKISNCSLYCTFTIYSSLIDLILESFAQINVFKDRGDHLPRVHHMVLLLWWCQGWSWSGWWSCLWSGWSAGPRSVPCPPGSWAAPRCSPHCSQHSQNPSIDWSRLDCGRLVGVG